MTVMLLKPALVAVLAVVLAVGLIRTPLDYWIFMMPVVIVITVVARLFRRLE